VSDQASSFTGNIPEHYDRSLGPILFADFASDIARRVASLAPQRVLELAAGTGIATRRLWDLLPAGARLTTTDLNPPMLEVARTKFGSEERVEFQPADAAALPFAESAIDAVACQFGVMFFPDKDRCYREVYRVLSPGGGYVFSVWDAHRYNPFGRLVHELIGSFFPDDPPQFYQVPFGYHRIDPIKDSLAEAGFPHLSVAVLNLEKQIPNAAFFAHGVIHGNPVIDQIQARGGVEPARIVDALTEAFRREFGPDPGRLPLQAIVFEARKR
jgi:ubiquinone/menaquinone biosynthesis C-methylase UbiE